MIMRALFLCCLVLLMAMGAYGQICPGSSLIYIVRDKKGVAIDAGGKDVTFNSAGTTRSNTWTVSDKDLIRGRKVEMPDKVRQLNNKLTGLAAFGMCNFKEPATLKVTIGGKTMELTFKFGPMGDVESTDYIVDSIPFKAGKYEITLNHDPKFYTSYYAPTGWKKIP